MSRSEITYADWDACLADGGCNGYRPGDMGERGDMPAMSISWRDAQAYASWLSGKAGRTYRLPTEAEWEYAARGGTQTPYWWGESFDRSKVSSGGPKASSSLPENGFGLVGTLGNVREWVEDCYVNNFSAAPADGSAVLTGSCDLRIIRGGAWSDNAATHRAANRARVSRGTRDRKIGFRVVSSDVNP
jgi:formylglycine-generating enzyme required for sulfatase activity